MSRKLPAALSGGRGRSIRQILTASINHMVDCDNVAREVALPAIRRLIEAPDQDPVVLVAAISALGKMQASARGDTIRAAALAHEADAEVIDATPEEPEDAEALESKLVRLVQSGG